MRCPILFLSFLAALLAGCNRERVVWFVQVTDPHFFEDITDLRKLPDPREDNLLMEEKARVFREGLSRDAFTDLMKILSALPGRKGKPDFLVITGDFGIDRFLPGAVTSEGGTPGVKTETQSPVVSTEAPNPDGAQGTNAQSLQATTSTPVQAGESLPPIQAAPEARKKEVDDAVEEVARRLRDSPVRDIFLVPGNNDVAGEDAGSQALAASAGFFDRVQARLAGNDVVLHDLSACYLGDQEPLSKCYFDIPDTPYRLVGFPSHSFKNKGKVEKTEKYDLYQAAQEKQIEVLGKLVQLAQAQHRKILVLTHVPELDDPHVLGQQRFAGKTPSKRNPDLPAASAWNVSPTVVTRWNEIIGSDTVAGVLAGHFHDSHREIYSPPYRWAADLSKRPTLDKLFLAPPLAARLQDTSPIQARGFAAFALAGDRPRRQLYWYDGVARTFQPEADGERPPGVAREESREMEAGWIERFGANFAWIWTIPESPEDLARAAILSIALLAAFLTVVQVWQIPPPVEGPGRSSPAGSGAAAASTASPSGTTTTTTTVASSSGTTSTTNAVTTNVFQSNLGKTVASGLTGLAVAVFLEEFWNQTQLNEKAYYLVLFSTFFLAMLFTSALFRGIGEALRSRVVIYRSHSAPVRGIWRWFLSWRSASLVFLDTAFNVIQGRNQMQSAVFEREIVDLNSSLVWTADRVREAIERALVKALEKHGPMADHGDVKVGVLTLSDDRRSAFYISAARGSAGPFSEGSTPVAAIQCGEARWCKLDDPKRTVEPTWQSIYGSSAGAKDGPWAGSDHRGFLVLPVPWTSHAEAVPARPAALHLSFRNAEDLDYLWQGLETPSDAGKSPNYACWRGLLDFEAGPQNGTMNPQLSIGVAPSASEVKPQERIVTRNAELAAVLRQALEVLGESLRYFNQTIFEERIRPYRKS